ncbi:MAG: hypothetical protein J6O41_01750, partial [Clostridia bacterium]|nr:hypothetical protein [Clostridia bacterium]
RNKIDFNKIYPLDKALELLSDPKYSEYTTIQEGDGFRIVKEEVAQNYTNQIIYDKKHAFRNRIKTDSSTTKNDNNNHVIRNYNNYQSAKIYNNWER